MKVNKKDHARTHEENRSIICFICMQKKKQNYSITGSLKGRMVKLCNYNSADDRLPNVLCVNCKINVIQLTKNDKTDSNSQKIILPDYSHWKTINTRSMNAGKCKCDLCKLAVTAGVPKQFFKNNIQSPTDARKKVLKKRKKGGIA